MTAEEYLNQTLGSSDAGMSADDFLNQRLAEAQTQSGIEGVAAGLEAGIGRAGTAFAQSAVASVRNLTDLFGANNPVSKKIAGVEDYIDQFTTAQAKQDNEEISRLFKEAEGKGLGSKVLAGLEAVSVSPETMLAQTAGYMVPSLAAGALATLASAPVTVAVGAQALVGGYQAAGMVKGDIYKSVRDYAREQGLDEVEADRAATEAQAYGGKNADLILMNAGLGALAASTGAEKIAARIIAGKGKEVTKKSIAEFLKKGTIGGFVEGGTEGLQEGAEQVSQNIALQREGKDVPTFENVPQAATMGAAAGAIMGGGFAGVEFLSAEEKEQNDIERAADREARSLSTTDTTTRKTINDLNQIENAIDSLREELDTMEPTDPRTQQLRMRISEEQKKAAGIKTTIGEKLNEGEKNLLDKEDTPTAIATRIEQTKVAMAGIDPTSRRYTELQDQLSADEGKLVEQQQAELAKKIAEEEAAPEVKVTEKPPSTRQLPTDVLPTETPGAMYGREAELYDVFAGVRRRPLAEAPTEAAPEVEPAEEVVTPVEAPAQVTEQVAPPTEQVAAPAVSETPAEAEGVAPKVGEIIAVDKANKTEFALVKGLLPGRPDMFSIGIRTLGSNQEFESGGYSHNINKDRVMVRFFEEERSRLKDIEIKNQYFQNILNKEEEVVSGKEAKETERKKQEEEKRAILNEQKARYEEAIAKVKLPTGKAETMRFTAPDGKEQALESTRYGSLGIRKVTSGKKSLYNVDHWPSGLRMMQFNSLSEAKRFAQAVIYSGADISNKDIAESERDKLYPVVKYFRTGEVVPTAPAVSETITEPAPAATEPVVTERDFTKPEQMTPEEYSAFEEQYSEREKQKTIATIQKEIPSAKELASIVADPKKGVIILKGQNEWYAVSVSGKRKLKYSVQEYGVRGTGFYQAPKSIGDATAEEVVEWINNRVKDLRSRETYYPYDPEIGQGEPIFKAFEKREPVSAVAYDSLEEYQKPKLPEGYVKQGELYVYQPTPAVSEAAPTAPTGIAVGNRIKLGRSPQTYVVEEVIPQTATERELGEQYYSVRSEKTGEVQTVEMADIKPIKRIRKGESGGVLIPSREDFEDLGRRIYEKGMQFKAWADRMVSEFGDAVREFLGDIWQAVSGIPAKINELAGYLPGKGEGGGVLVPMGEEPPKKGVERYKKKSQVAGIKNSGSMIDTPKGIKKTTEKIIKDRFINADDVSETNTAKAWNLIGKLQKSNPESEQTVSAINELVRETIQDTEADDVVKQSIGGAIMRNELYKYAIKLTAQGDNKMLNYLLNNRLAIASGAIDEGDAGRLLNALANLKNWIVRASDSEQSAFIEIAAARFFGVKKPTDDQIKQIKSMFEAVKATKIDQEKELSAELEEVGKATGIDVAQKVVEAVESSVATRDPWIVAFEILRRELGEPLAGFAFKPFTMAEAIKKALIPKLSNYQKSMAQQGAKGLEATFWKTMSDQEKKLGPLAEVDAAINRNLAAIVKDTLIKLGLKGKPDNTKMTLIEQVANILTNQKLTQEKMVLADKRVLEEINRREGIALEMAGEDQDAIDAAEAEAQALRDAWNEAMGQQMNLPVSEATLGRLINNEMKEAGTKLSEIETLSELEPAIAEARKVTIVNSIINKLYGIVLVPTDRKPLTKEELAALEKQVSELQAELANDKKRKASQSVIDARQNELNAAIERRDAEKKRTEIPKRDYDILSKALSDKFNQMIEARKLKSKMAKAARDAKAGLNNPDKQAESQIKRLAKIQSDTQEWATSKKDEVKAIVQNDLRNTPDMGRKEPWKAMLVGQLKQAGVSDTQAGVLADLVWNQHEKNALSREMDALNKAVEKGPIKGIVDAILNTPLSEQQKPEWRKEVIKKYLIDAGVASTKADNIAKLFDISLQKRFAEAQVKAAEKALKGIGGKLTPESKRAFQAFIKAIRAQVVNPGTDAAKEFGKQMGWKGFTPEQIAKINELDAIIESDTSFDADRFAAIKKIQDIVASVSLPPSAMSAFSSFYIGNALGRITTASIQVVDPALYAAFDTAVDTVRLAATNPAQVPAVIYNYFASLHRMMKEIAFSFRNDINRSGKMVDYLDNNDAKITRIFQDGQKLWKEGKYNEGLKKMLFGYPAITFRTLKALDDGSFSLLKEAAITRYVTAAMDMAKIPKKDQRGVIRGMLQGREMDIKQMVAQGLSKTDATVYANERMMKEITNTLSGLNIDPEDTINSIINDSLSRLGKTRFIEEITGEGSEIKDKGTLSHPFIKFYESTSRAIQKINGPEGEAMRVLQRVLFGFPLIPARMFNIAAGYTPLTLYRHFLTGRYPLTYGTAMQRKQRLIEQMSGVLALAPFLLLRSMSLDDEDKEGVRVYFTGQGPLKSQDKTLNQQWNLKHKPYSMEVWIGNKKVALDAKASGPLGVLIYTMGAIDDWQIRNRIRNDKITEDDWRSAEEKLNTFTAMYELAGSFVLTTARRGPTTGVMQGLVDFLRYPDDPIASIGSELSFSAIPAVPVLGMGVVKNISDMLSEPIDTSTIKGALLNNIPIVGPLATKPAINTFGQKIGELQVSEKLKKATGIPFTLTDYSNQDDQKLANITMKYGDGPEPIKRSWLEDQFESMITDEEWYAGAEAFGKANRQMVLEDYNYLNGLTNEEYRDEMEAITKSAREDAYDAVEKLRSKNLTRPQR